MSSRRLMAVALLALCAWAETAGAAGRAVPPAQRDPFGEQVDALVRDGFERPTAALAALGALQKEHPDSPDVRRELLLAIGSVEAQTGGAAHAAQIAEQLLSLSPDDPSGRAVASSNLVRALAAENASQLDVAAALAQSALPAFLAGCPTNATASAVGARKFTPADNAECNYRAASRALEILERRTLAQGLFITARAHTSSALALAEWAGDFRLQAQNLGALAYNAQRRGDDKEAQRLMLLAKRMAAQVVDLQLQARISNYEARIAVLENDNAAGLQFYEQALALAVLANAPRLEAIQLNDLSDIYVRMRRPADALRAAERALLIVRLHNDQRAERVLLINAGVAKIGVGRIAEGKQDLAQVLELWKQSGETGRQVNTLREFGEALAAAGDARSALDLFHREQALTAALDQTNRNTALKELQTRNEANARERDIELLGRDNALKTAALSNRDLLQRISWLIATVMLLAITLVAMLYRRVRETNRKLAASHIQLQAQSERDPLTNLANRRHFQAVMEKLAMHGGFEGALLLVDLDHFKRINDVHGHGAGDQVLVEVAQRLNEAVRHEDLVVRWGGEEFLILAPSAASEQTEQMAARVLRILGETPVTCGTQSLRIAASIGYARFPLPPHGAKVPWEQALNLVDMALYTAKNQGRNRAVGIASTTASTSEALRDIESDFECAWRDARVTLVQTPGPEFREPVRAAAA
jgi:diguanylate cyclase (GGDEF)-like protein